jgi:RNA polymerase sigma-70 factor (ECF subfamily)
MKTDALIRILIRDRAQLLGFIWAIVRDHHLADDVFQEVTVLALERAGEINDEGHLLLWARKAARFKALEILRRKSYRMILLDEDVLESLEAGWAAGDTLSSSSEAGHLKACIERLTPRAREILHLRYTEGLSGVQVAEIVNVKVASVYVMLTRIYQALEKCISGRRTSADLLHG